MDGQAPPAEDMSLAGRAREAIELVCTGRRPDLAATLYSPDFVDHVNALVFHGYDGARESVALYRRIFSDFSIEVDEQLTEGNRVATRWTLHGSYLRRKIQLRGIAISRFEDGRVAEDWSATDTIELAWQLGLSRTLVLAAREWRMLLRLARRRQPSL